MAQDNENKSGVNHTIKRNLDIEECPECGSQDLEVETVSPEGMLDDGDTVTCWECGMTGSIFCDSETFPYVSWINT